MAAIFAKLASDKQKKFTAIKEYLQYLDVEDLAILSVEDLVDMVEPKDKPLMKVFAYQYLVDYLNQPNPTFPSKSLLQRESPPSKIVTPGNYSKSVQTSAFPGLQLSPGKITLEDALRHIQEYKPPIIDLSDNNLYDVDLPAIAKAISYGPEEVNLSRNRIHGYSLSTRELVDESLRTIIQHTVKYVVLFGNPLASIDRQDLFDTFDKETFAKLIWIPLPWLEPKQWKTMITNESFHLIIYNTHQDYYNNKAK